MSFKADQILRPITQPNLFFNGMTRNLKEESTDASSRFEVDHSVVDFGLSTLPGSVLDVPSSTASLLDGPSSTSSAFNVHQVVIKDTPPVTENGALSEVSLTSAKRVPALQSSPMEMNLLPSNTLKHVPLSVKLVEQDPFSVATCENVPMSTAEVEHAKSEGQDDPSLALSAKTDSQSYNTSSSATNVPSRLSSSSNCLLYTSPSPRDS